MKDTEHIEDVELEANLLAICRAAVRREGKESTSAQAAFRKFEDKWRPEVARRVIAKFGRNHLFAEDLVEDTFAKTWAWINGPSGLPEPSILLNTCLDRAHTDLMRKLYGRQQATDRLRNAEGAEEPSVEHEPERKAGTDPRFPLSLERDDDDLGPLIEKIGDIADVEFEVVAKEAIREGLASLLPHYRDCVICRLLQGLSVPETQAKLGLTYDQVTKYTAAGIARLTAYIIEALRD